jgi:hypothetical protein
MQQARTRFATERTWLIAAVVLVVLATQTPVASHLSPKGGIGYALGVIGGLLLLTPALCAFRTRMLSFRTLLVSGTLAPVLILIHCGFSLGATNSNIALAAMLLVTCSSLLGRYFYTRTHTDIDFEQRVREIKQGGQKLPMLPELAARLDQEERRLVDLTEWGAGAVLAPFALSGRYTSSHRELCDYARGAINEAAARHKTVAAQQARFEQVTFDYIERRLRATRDLAEYHVYERLFAAWRVLHVPLFLVLIAAGIVHIISVHVY